MILWVLTTGGRIKTKSRRTVGPRRFRRFGSGPSARHAARDNAKTASGACGRRRRRRMTTTWSPTGTTDRLRSTRAATRRRKWVPPLRSAVRVRDGGPRAVCVGRVWVAGGVCVAVAVSAPTVSVRRSSAHRRPRSSRERSSEAENAAAAAARETS